MAAKWQKLNHKQVASIRRGQLLGPVKSGQGNALNLHSTQARKQMRLMLHSKGRNNRNYANPRLQKVGAHVNKVDLQMGTQTSTSIQVLPKLN